LRRLLRRLWLRCLLLAQQLLVLLLQRLFALPEDIRTEPLRGRLEGRCALGNAAIRAARRLARDGREHFALRALCRAQAPEFGAIEWTAAVGLKGALLQIEARCGRWRRAMR